MAGDHGSNNANTSREPAFIRAGYVISRADTMKWTKAVLQRNELINGKPMPHFSPENIVNAFQCAFILNKEIRRLGGYRLLPWSEMENEPDWAEFLVIIDERREYLDSDKLQPNGRFILTEDQKVVNEFIREEGRKLLEAEGITQYRFVVTASPII